MTTTRNLLHAGPRSRMQPALLAEECGNSLVETALSITVLTACMLCIMSCSMLIYAKHFAASAARLGSRYAIVRGSTYTGIPCSSHAYNCTASITDVTNYVLSSIPAGLSVSATSVQVLWPGLAASGLSCITVNGVNSPGCVVQVIVTYQLGFNLPLLPSGFSSFQSASTMMIEQ